MARAPEKHQRQEPCPGCSDQVLVTYLRHYKAGGTRWDEAIDQRHQAGVDCGNVPLANFNE